MTAAQLHLTLRFELLSAATFGRGEGLAGLVDQEVEHDDYGLPYLRGRALRGLLAEEMEGLLAVLPSADGRWQASRDRLLGVTGRLIDESGILHIGDACLPENLRRLLVHSLADQKKLTRLDILGTLTAIRRQTAMTERGAPESASLRALRVVLRGVTFESALQFASSPSTSDLALLTATVLAWRRAGSGRNRGRGRLRAWLEDEAWTKQHFDNFCREVGQ